MCSKKDIPFKKTVCKFMPKGFMKITPKADSRPYFTDFRNKLESFSLASLYNLV